MRRYTYQLRTAPPPVRVGFTNPARIWPKIADVQVAARALDEQIQRYVADADFKRRWSEWYANWRANYGDKFESSYAFARASALLDTDALDRDVESQRQTFLGWREQYAKQRQADGNLVPQPTPSPGPGPGPSPSPSPPSEGWSVPWWVWAVLGVGAAGIAYSIYRQAKVVKAQGKFATEKLLPAVLESRGVPASKEISEYAAIGQRDPARHFRMDTYVRKAPPRRDSALSLRRYVSSDMPNFAYDASKDPLRGR